MTTNSNQLISLQDLTEELVVEYLCAHPEFFQCHEDLLDNLDLPHNCGKASSLIEHQVQRLREQNQQLNSQVYEYVDTAAKNEHLFAKVHELTVDLLEVKSLAELVDCLESHLLSDFGADFVRFGTRKQRILETGSPMVFRLRNLNQETAIHDMLQSGKASCRCLPKDQKQYLFQTDYKQVGSVAVLPLGPRGSIGLLAIGSSNRRHFHHRMDTFFLDHLGDIISGMIDRLS